MDGGSLTTLAASHLVCPAMKRIAASLAAVLLAATVAACGDGAEPDAPSDGARSVHDLTVILDFVPNPVHAGIYVAEARGLLADQGVELEIREPGAATDAPRLLEAGKVELAVLDIQDLAIARESGLDLVGIGAIVQRPLAAVIAADADEIREPADLAGATVGVAGLPSDEAVLNTVLGGEDAETVTIGFNAVQALSGGEVDAATAFWNAEGVQLRELGVPTREFRVDEYGAPRYPELILTTTREQLESDREAIEATLAALAEGYAAVEADPEAALDDLVAAVPGLEREAQVGQMEALAGAFSSPIALDRAPMVLDRGVLEDWAVWAAENGITEGTTDVDAAFDFSVAPSAN